MVAVYKSVHYPGLKERFELPFGYARSLRPADVPALQKVCELCSDMALQLTGLPPGKDAAAQLLAANSHTSASGSTGYVIGIFDRENHLIGVLVARSNEPVRGDWYIGNFMLVPELRSRGYGAQTIHAFAECLSDTGCERILLAVMWTNEDGMRFWSNNGFEPLRPIEPTRFGHMLQTGIEMVRFLHAE